MKRPHLIRGARAWLADPRNARKITLALIALGLDALRRTLAELHERQDELEADMSRYARLEDIVRVRHDIARLLGVEEPRPVVDAEVVDAGDVEEEPTWVRTMEGEGA